MAEYTEEDRKFMEDAGVFGEEEEEEEEEERGAEERGPKEPDNPYDVVVLVARHGGYAATAGRRKDCLLTEVPPKTKITILEAAPCGIFAMGTEHDWGPKIRKIDELVRRYGRSDDFAQRVQGYLRRETNHELQPYMDQHKDLLSIIEANKTMRLGPEDIGDSEETRAFFKQLERVKDTNDFLKADRWKIKTFLKKYDDRSYSDTSPENDLVANINTVISSGIADIPLGPIAVPINNRSDLIEYLWEHGSRNPFIIDYSCGFVDSELPDDISGFADFIKSHSRGGRKSKRKSKRKSTRKR